MQKKLFALLLSVLLSVVGRCDPNLVPFTVDWERADGAAVDLSRFLDAPAGRAGFLRVKDGHIHKPNGTRFRIWGVNMVGPHCFPDKDVAPRLAEDLARMGVNSVRFHHMDSDWDRSAIDMSRGDTRHLDPENMDRFDFFVAELKKRGIYTNLNLNVSRKYKEGDEVRDHEILGLGKGATYFNERLIELQQEYATKLLTHENKYTGNEYRNEPAVAVVEIVNENSLLEAWVGWRLVGRDDRAGRTWSPIPVSYARELTEMYNAWLAKNLEPDQLKAIRKEAGAGSNDLLSRLKPDQFLYASPMRFYSEAMFYMQLEHDFFARMRELLKEQLGVQSLLIGTADHNDGYGAYLHIAANMMFDIIDGHGYWQHPRIGAETAIENTPMVNAPLVSTVTQFARTPVVGMPFTISETNHPFPHEYACEGYPILTAYALFHDWDGLYWFCFGQGRVDKDETGIPESGWFYFANDPVKMANLYSCAIMWHRKDIKTARETIVRSYSQQEMMDALRVDSRARPFFTPDFARSTALRHATRFAIDGTKSSLYPLPAPTSIVESDTGQLVWRNANIKQGCVSIESDFTQGLVGYVRDSGRALSRLSANVENDFCALLLTSYDDNTIWQSNRLLLTATALATNTDFEWKEDRKTVAQWGHGPVVIEPVSGELTLRNIRRARALTYTALTAEGRPLQTLKGQSEDGRNWTLTLGDPATTWYLIRIQR